MTYVKDAMDAKKMIVMERQAMGIAHELQQHLNKRKISAPVACLAIHEVYHRTKAFYPQIMNDIEANALIPDQMKKVNK